MSETIPKNEIDQVIEYLKNIESYVDLETLYRYANSNADDNVGVDVGIGVSVKDTDDIRYPVNTKDLESVTIAELENESFRPIGIFKTCPINSDFNTSNNSTHIAIVKEEDRLIFRIDDLPHELGYEVRNVEELQHFIDVYYHNGQNSDNFVVELFDLRRNKSFRPIMMERYMILSRFTEPWVYGPFCNPELVENYLEVANSFNISVQYNDILRQEESSFMITTRTKYSRSLITVKFRQEGVVCEVEYVPVHPDLVKEGGIMHRFLESIIAKGSDFSEDLPLDVILFLAPMSPYRYEKLVDEIENNRIVLDKNILTIFDEIYDVDRPRGCTEDVHREEYIGIMKRFYKIVEDNEDFDDGMKSDIQEMIRVDITDRYVEKFKREYDTQNLGDEQDLQAVLNSAIQTVKDDMAADSLSDYASPDYIEYLISIFFETNLENSDPNDPESE